jgi:integrase/recombinase XerD
VTSRSAAADHVPDAALLRAAGTYLDHLTVERALSANTLSAYRRDLDRYLIWLTDVGVADLASVAPRQVAAYLASLREGTSTHPPLLATSAARAISAVRGLHRFGVREGLSADDPSRDIVPPTPPKRLPKALSVTDIIALLTAVGSPDDLLALRDRALLEFLYGTGARISEAVGADRDDIDLVDGTAILHGKGGKTRLVPVGTHARTALDAYFVRARPALIAAGRGTHAIFLNARGGRPRSGPDVTAHIAPFLCDTPARRRRRRARRPGVAGPRVGHDHAGLYARDGRASARGLRLGAPPGARVSHTGLVSIMACLDHAHSRLFWGYRALRAAGCSDNRVTILGSIR